MRQPSWQRQRLRAEQSSPAGSRGGRCHGQVLGGCGCRCGDSALPMIPGRQACQQGGRGQSRLVASTACCARAAAAAKRGRWGPGSGSGCRCRCCGSRCATVQQCSPPAFVSYAVGQRCVDLHAAFKPRDKIPGSAGAGPYSPEQQKSVQLSSTRNSTPTIHTSTRGRWRCRRGLA